MADIAKDMQAMSKSYEVIANSLGISLDAAARLLEALLNNKDSQQLAQMILKHAIDPTSSKKDVLVAREISPEIIPVIKTLLQREPKIAASVINFDSDNKNSKNSLLYFSNQKEKVELIMNEALARAGLINQIDREKVEPFIGKLKDNPMKEVKGLTEKQYEELLADIAKLKYPANKITLFPNRYERNGENMVDVGFLEETMPRKIQKQGEEVKNAGPYSIPNLVKGLLIKQQMLENAKNSFERGVLFEQRVSYKKDIVIKNFDINTIKKDRRGMINMQSMLNKMEIEPDIKQKLLKLLKSSTLSKDARDQLIDEIQKLDVNELEKGQVLNKINDLSDMKYIIPATIVQDGKVPAYELDRSNYARIGSEVSLNSGDKTLKVLMKNAEQELKQFASSNMTSENQTLLILTQGEFEKLEKGRKDKSYKKEEFEYTKKGEERIAPLYSDVMNTDRVGNDIIKTINSNIENLSSEKISENMESMDSMDKAAEEMSPEAIKDILMDNKDVLLDTMDNKELFDEAVEIVESDFQFNRVSDPYYIDNELEDAEEEIESDRNTDINMGRDYDNPEPDDFYDLDHDGVDDREQ